MDAPDAFPSLPIPLHNDSLFNLLYQWLSALAAQENPVESFNGCLCPNSRNSDLFVMGYGLDIKIF